MLHIETLGAPDDPSDGLSPGSNPSEILFEPTVAPNRVPLLRVIDVEIIEPSK